MPTFLLAGGDERGGSHGGRPPSDLPESGEGRLPPPSAGITRLGCYQEVRKRCDALINLDLPVGRKKAYTST
jgi:hypothetical protein